MSIKTKQVIELLGALLTLYLILLAFFAIFPFIATKEVPLPLVILFELSPFILMVGVAIIFTKINKRHLTKALGFEKSNLVKQLGPAAVIFAITVSFVVIPLVLGADKGDVLSVKAGSPLILCYYILKKMVFVGMGEELVWRGYFYSRLQEITGSGIWAVILSAALFGLFHFPGSHNWMQVIMTGILGLVYGFARLKLNNCTVLSTGIAHGLHDTTITILSYLLL